MSELEKARKFFYKDRFAKKAGIELIEVGEKYAKCTLEIKDEHKNALGAVMGGVMFTLADFTFAVASNNNGDKTVTTTSQITYFSSPKGNFLISESKLLKDGRMNCFYEIEIKDELGNMIAKVATTGTHIK